MSVQDYYAKMQKGMIRAGVHEETKDKIYCFYSGLRTEIQDIVDYKEYNIVNHLFQLAMFAEKELQGHQPTKTKTSSRPVQHLQPHPEPLCVLERVLDDNFGFTSSFHVIDAFYNNTSCYKSE
jgi:hypothetical protein